MRTPAGDAPAVYEITVVGPVGPVLRKALKPRTAGPGHLETILRTSTRDDLDLVDLARRLHAHGATVTDIALLRRADPGGVA